MYHSNQSTKFIFWTESEYCSPGLSQVISKNVVFEYDFILFKVSWLNRICVYYWVGEVQIGLGGWKKWFFEFSLGSEIQFKCSILLVGASTSCDTWRWPLH